MPKKKILIIENIDDMLWQHVNDLQKSLEHKKKRLQEIEGQHQIEQAERRGQLQEIESEIEFLSK